MKTLFLVREAAAKIAAKKLDREKLKRLAAELEKGGRKIEAFAARELAKDAK